MDHRLARRVDEVSDMLDGFRPHDSDAFVGFRDDASARASEALDWLAKKLHVEVEGIDRLPAGRALIVANHAFGWDVAFPMAEVRRVTGRPVFALGEHLWWKIPFLRRLAAAVGTVDGTPENVDRLLQNEQLVVVLPGGMREAVKPKELRYRLLWGARYGFVRAAIRNATPIVPLAAIGSDEVFDFVGDAVARGERWLAPLGLDHIPLPRPSKLFPFPHRVHLRYVFGDPIAPLHPPSSADDPAALRIMRWTVEGALHELIDRELARRTGVDE